MQKITLLRWLTTVPNPYAHLLYTFIDGSIIPNFIYHYINFQKLKRLKTPSTEFFKLCKELHLTKGSVFGSVFQFSHYKTAVFRFWCLCGLRVFSNLVFGFQFLSTMIAVFPIFLPNAFYGFSGFAKEVAPRSRAKTLILRDHLQLEECMTSLVSALTAVIWVVTAAKQTMKS